MSRVVVAAEVDVPGRGVLLVQASGLEIGLFRVRGRVVAWRNHCPHQAAPVCRGRVTGTLLPSAVAEYRPGRDGEVLQCPWHGWEFDLLDGHHLASGSRVRLRGYPVEVEDGNVVLHLPERPALDAAGRGAATRPRP
ncbi:Rieske (2Fe-2S) protein [Desertihabitans brevis]|uniref:Rieske (2Fe-2S) protein n=1 Tax=Desertihabitans brevis TaxID=2268447 RepID=A0A367YU09_9ACTN|nr:Rieske (2Fe-2S) protein [Desertihabitans brevis]